MQNDADTDVAIKEINGAILFGKPISVQKSRAREGDPPPYYPPRGSREKRPLSPPRRAPPRRFVLVVHLLGNELTVLLKVICLMVGLIVMTETGDMVSLFMKRFILLLTSFPDDRGMAYPHDEGGSRMPPPSSGSRMPPPSRYDSYDSYSSRPRAPDEYKRSIPEPKSDRYSLRNDQRYPAQSTYPEDMYSRADQNKSYTAPPPGRDSRGYPEQGRDYYQRSEYGYTDTKRPPPDTRRDPVRDANHGVSRSGYDQTHPPTRDLSHPPARDQTHPPARDRYNAPHPSDPSSYPSNFRTDYDKPADVRQRSGWDDTGRRDPPPAYSYGRSEYNASNYAPEYPNRTYDPPSSYSDRPPQNPPSSGFPDYRSESFPSGQSQYSYTPSQAASSSSSTLSSDIQSVLKTLSQATSTFSTSSYTPPNDQYAYPTQSAGDPYRPYPSASYSDNRDAGNRSYRPLPQSSTSAPPLKAQDPGYPPSSVPTRSSDPYGASRSYPPTQLPPNAGPPSYSPMPSAPGGHPSSSLPPTGGGRGGYGYVRSDMPKPPGRYEPYRQ